MNTRYINTPTLCVWLQRTSSTNRKLLDGSLTYMSKCVSTRSKNKISAFVVSRNYNYNLPNFLLESSTLSSGEKIFFNIRQNFSSLFIFELLSLDTTEISYVADFSLVKTFRWNRCYYTHIYNRGLFNETEGLNGRKKRDEIGDGVIVSSQRIRKSPFSYYFAARKLGGRQVN